LSAKIEQKWRAFNNTNALESNMASIRDTENKILSTTIALIGVLLTLFIAVEKTTAQDNLLLAGLSLLTIFLLTKGLLLPFIKDDKVRKAIYYSNYGYVLLICFIAFIGLSITFQKLFPAYFAKYELLIDIAFFLLLVIFILCLKFKGIPQFLKCLYLTDLFTLSVIKHAPDRFGRLHAEIVLESNADFDLPSITVRIEIDKKAIVLIEDSQFEESSSANRILTFTLKQGSRISQKIILDNCDGIHGAKFTAASIYTIKSAAIKIN